jgi:hypothetical protein
MVLNIICRGASIGISLLLESQIHIAGAINVLNLLSVQLVLLNVVSVVVERISNAVDFTSNLLFDLGLGVDLPDLSEFASEFEVNTAGDESVTTSLMHGTDPVNVKLFGDSFETTREIKFSFDFLAIVIVDEVGVQRLQVVVLKHGQKLTLQLSKEVAEIYTTVKGDPMIFSVQHETRSDEVFCE